MTDRAADVIHAFVVDGSGLAGGPTTSPSAGATSTPTHVSCSGGRSGTTARSVPLGSANGLPATAAGLAAS